MNDQGRDTVQTRWGWTVHAGCEGKFENEGCNRRVMQNTQTREETSFGLLSFFLISFLDGRHLDLWFV